MAFTLSFTTESDAFTDGEDNFVPGPEIARILRDVLDMFDGGMYSIDGPAIPIKDVNGNRVGHYRLTTL